MPNTKMEAMFDRAEELGWSYRWDEGGGIELYKASPAGEDFGFDVYAVKDAEDLADQIREYAIDFDPEDHVVMWLGAKKSGTSGVPGIKTLGKDADDIQEMLKELAGAMEDVLLHYQNM